MNNCFIYSFKREVEVKGKGLQKQIHLVIFFPYKDFLKNQSDIQIQLRSYFHHNTLPDKLIVICHEFNKEIVKELFQEGSEIFNYIPRFEFNHNENSICAVSLNGNGQFSTIIGKSPSEKEINEIYNKGLTKIFRRNGGLIVAQPAHHFVFPSGKHSDRFLRTGNVLIHGVEIMFIASALVKYFKRSKVSSIYSDTSSINSLAYAYVNLLKDLNPNFSESVSIDSFSSYKVFENSKHDFRRGAIFLISSSTSGSILERMTVKNKTQSIDLKDIAIVYGLSVKDIYKSQVICDLTLSTNNYEGIDPFESYNISRAESCAFCDGGSKPLKVEGDVFLLEKPIVTSYQIKKSDLPNYLKGFSNYYKKSKDLPEPIIRSYHKENSTEKKYEIYIDIHKLLDEWGNRGHNHPYEPIFAKLEKYILQSIPASIKYMIVLPDLGSKKLAQIISKVLNEHGVSFSEENIIGIESEELKKIKIARKGTIAVISSSIVTGRNLLYLSRALREFEENYRRIFFTLISRTENKSHINFLQSNLGLGEFGPDTHKLFNVETIHCPNEAQNTPWHIEEKFIKKFLDFLEEENSNEISHNYCIERLKELSTSGHFKGLSDNLFFPSLKRKILKIRNGFAFAPFLDGKEHTNFIKESSQSEIYFIVSTILNDLRNKGIFDQSEYVRNIVDPGNFVRFNDGVLQACLLRSSFNEELDFSLSEEHSKQMKSILGDMILHLNDDHAEALNEFFYAVAVKKMRLLSGDIEDCIELLEGQKVYREKDSLLKGLVEYIKANILEKQSVESKFKNLPKAEIHN